MTDQRRGWLWKMLLEVLLIGVAVFLGMAADQWRTDRQHREQARAALQLIQAMYLRPPSENLEGFFHSVKIYLDDIVAFDPGLIAAYDRVVPVIDSALRD
jgi:hypothetical protein